MNRRMRLAQDACQLRRGDERRPAEGGEQLSFGDCHMVRLPTLGRMADNHSAQRGGSSWATIARALVLGDYREARACHTLTKANSGLAGPPEGVNPTFPISTLLGVS